MAHVKDFSTLLHQLGVSKTLKNTPVTAPQNTKQLLVGNIKQEAHQKWTMLGH